jgi:hypothetical protein
VKELLEKKHTITEEMLEAVIAMQSTEAETELQ